LSYLLEYHETAKEEKGAERWAVKHYYVKQHNIWVMCSLFDRIKY